MKEFITASELIGEFSYRGPRGQAEFLNEKAAQFETAIRADEREKILKGARVVYRFGSNALCEIPFAWYDERNDAQNHKALLVQIEKIEGGT